METYEQIMMSVSQYEMAELLARLCDGLKISPPCLVTKSRWISKMENMVLKDRAIAEAAERLKQAQMDFLRLP